MGIKYTFDENYFEIIDSEDKAYDLGFSYADATISYDPDSNTYVYHLMLARKDKCHLAGMLARIHSDFEINDFMKLNTFPSGEQKWVAVSAITVCSKKFVSDLVDKGCGPRKTQVIRLPTDKIPEHFMRHFIRGYLDGDGCWYLVYRDRKHDGNPKLDGSVSLLSNKEFCDDTKKWLIDRNIIDKAVVAKKKKAEIFYMRCTGLIQISKLFHFVYNGATIFLGRKYNKVKDKILCLDEANARSAKHTIFSDRYDKIVEAYKSGASWSKICDNQKLCSRSALNKIIKKEGINHQFPKMMVATAKNRIDLLIDSIYSLNYFYRKLKLAGPLYKSWIKRAIDQNRIEVLRSSGDTLIGFMIFTELKEKPFFTLQKIFIDGKYCHNGHGQELLDILKQKATEKQRGIQVRTSKNNERAISFYKKNGFTETIDPIKKQKKYESIYLTWNP